MDIINSVWGGMHTAAAVIALATGAYVLMRPKGDGRHRSVGRVYAAAMVLLVLAGIPMAENGLSAFHYLSIITAISIAAGMVMIWRARFERDPKTRAGLVFGHYKFMAWSYAGLVAAGAAQLATRIAVAWGGMATFWWAVVAASLAICGLAALWIRLSDRLIIRRYARALDAGAS
ncbi:DUF2306 domain-containing protein [Hyphobacterium marinum]|uniref:DUF2306 domain-containing protein n=1 Tax=Hyphobacterium marinum TaxID=3116574 RepID=A0ABU7LWW9_9PROT|nr:DUF2306 domain-containing protein [Hyphobacterium sp. Y6023]MEE2566063.1 DUF2306 domain-containing protein [Hyphobacterium sp. Y6023]